MAIVLYEGRVVSVRILGNNRYAEVIAEGPHAGLSAGLVEVLVNEAQPYRATLREGELGRLNDAEAALIERHGSPRKFAEACWRAVPEISPAEAQEAIWKYNRELNCAREGWDREDERQRTTAILLEQAGRDGKDLCARYNGVFGQQPTWTAQECADAIEDALRCDAE